MRRPRIAVLCAFALAAGQACASASGAPAADVEQTIRMSDGMGGSMQVRTTAAIASSVSSVSTPIDRVWAALPAAFDSIGVKLSLVDRASYTMGNTSMRLRRELGRVPLSRYINCGNAQGSPSADTYEVQGSIVTALGRDPDGGTTITTTFETSARSVTVAGEFAPCTSKGVLEQRLVELVRGK